MTVLPGRKKSGRIKSNDKVAVRRGSTVIIMIIRPS